MPRPLFACTPSRLGLFSACPRRYRFTYLDRPVPTRGAPWAHTSVGAAVHVALKQWWDLPASRRSGRAAVGLLRSVWSAEGFRDPAQAARHRELAETWVRRYLDELDPQLETVAAERTVATTTATLALSGRVDRVDRGEDGLVVVDYKTGRHVPTPLDAARSTALAVYVLGVRRTYRARCRRVELHHLPSGTVAGHDHDESSLAAALRSAEEVGAATVAATEALTGGADPDRLFPARPGRQCSWCDFRRHCPPGRAAAPPRAAWAGLAGVDGAPGT